MTDYTKFTYSSTTMAYNKNSSSYMPKFGLIRNNSGFFSIFCFNDKKQDYHRINFIQKYINAHLCWLADNHAERIQRRLDDGSLYLYLRRLDNRACAVVDRQVEKWQETDKEYLLAKETGDFLREVGLMNNMIARAEEIMYPCIIYA